jgi:hypothetical protein
MFHVPRWRFVIQSERSEKVCVILTVDGTRIWIDLVASAEAFEAEKKRCCSNARGGGHCVSEI